MTTPERLTNQEVERWQKRKEALISFATLVKNASNLPNGSNHSGMLSKSNFQILVDAFISFASAHYQFFLDGFAPGGRLQLTRTSSGVIAPTSQIKPPEGTPAAFYQDKYPPEYILRELINRMAHDVRMLEMIANQRSLYQSSTSIQNLLAATFSATNNPSNAFSNPSEVLAIADALGTDALIPNLGEPLDMIITYFERMPLARVIPYAKVGLVGIPYSALQRPKDLLALYHEMGHGVFWNTLSKATRNEFWRAAKQRVGYVENIENPDVSNENLQKLWLSDWTEEIFADIYGILTGKLPIADSWQEMMSQNSDDQIWHCDNDHPMPWIRMELYDHVLAQLNYPEQIRSALKNKRDPRLTASPPKPTVKVHTGLILPVQDIRTHVLAMADTILAKIRTMVGDAYALDYQVSSEDEDYPNSAKMFRERIRLLRQKTRERLNIINQISVVTWADWVTQHFPNLPAEGEVAYDDWFKVFFADGWTTEGPHTYPSTIP